MHKTSISLEDDINSEILKEMQEVFTAADVDGGGYLDVDEFVNAFHGTLSTEDGGDAAALRKLFNRVDVNADGAIDWNEFVGYMLLEKKTARHRDLPAATFSLTPTVATLTEKQAHRGSMTALCKVPPSAGGAYVSTGQDGSVVFWNVKDLTHEKTLREGSCWITAASFLPNASKLCIADFTRGIKIYDCSSFHFVGSIHDLPYAPLCSTAWKSNKRRDEDYICIGDVVLYETKCVVSDKKHSDRFNHRLKWRRQLHGDMVMAVRYVEELRSIVAASSDATLSISDVEHEYILQSHPQTASVWRRMTVKRLRGHTKSVNACDWSSFYKFVCSGGQDRSVVLWNPFSQRPLATLIGHAAPVVGVAVRDCGNQLISLSTDKCIKVWDIRNHGCLQTFTDKERYHPHDTLTAMLFDHEEQSLLCGNKKIKEWKLENLDHGKDATHDGVLVDVLYNALFNEVVTADSEGTICIWILETVNLRSKFTVVEETETLTAVCLDHNARRLLTANDRGICHMWNFSNGSLLKSFHLRSGLEIGDVVCFKMHGQTKIAVAGWDHQLTLFEDNAIQQHISPMTTSSEHEGDIVSLALGNSVHLLASADILGQILVWNMESWTIKKKLMTEKSSPVIEIGFLSGRWRHVLLSSSEDGCLKAWNAFDGCTVWQGTCSGATAFSIHPTSNAIATGSENGWIEVLELEETEDVLSYRRMHRWSSGNARCLSIAWVEEQQALLIADGGNHIGLWQSNGNLLSTFGDSIPQKMNGLGQQTDVLRQQDPDSETDLHNKHHSVSHLRRLEVWDDTSSESDDDIPASLWQRSWPRQR